MLPSLPIQSLSTYCFVERNDYLCCLVTPFQITSDVQKIYFTLDLRNPEEWEETTNPRAMPDDFNAKLQISIQFPAKIVNEPYYYFVDASGTIVFKTVHSPVKRYFVTTQNFNYYSPEKRRKMEEKRKKKALKNKKDN